MHIERHRFGIASMLVLGIAPAAAWGMQSAIDECAAIHSDRARLACYDRAVAAAHAQRAQQENRARPHRSSGVSTAAGTSHAGAADDSRLAQHWELDPEDKRGTFVFRPHLDNYLIATYNPAPNDAPYLPYRALTPGAKGLVRSELAFQLGFKLKLVQNLFDYPVDLWFGYTQRSFWQAANHRASSPFRETDYQPELMAVVPVHVDLPGLPMRFVNFGLLHQSNGQSSTLSRSWNRAYMQLGFERRNFTLLARVWKRFSEPASEDNNPQIIDYMGRGDIVATYRRRGQEFSLLARHNFQTDKGAQQLSWTFPLKSYLQGRIQYFSGYGYSLIDYDAFQHVLGFGIAIRY